MENNTSGKEKFKWGHIPSLLMDTYKAWNKNNPFRLSAVVAYYAVLSLPSLLIIIVSLVGAIWGQDGVEAQITSEFSGALGEDAGESVKDMIGTSKERKRGTLSTIIGIGTLIYGATGLFYQLQVALNEVWNVKPDPDAKWWKLLVDRARSLTFILVIGFLLLISFVLTAGISALRERIGRSFSEDYIAVTYILDFAVSISIITILFALIYRFLPDVKIKWATVWLGALVTAVLFVIGKFVLSYYFGQSDPGSTYGAAGSVILILLWVSYSSLILFFGAEFTYVYAKRYGSGIVPQGFAEKRED